MLVKGCELPLNFIEDGGFAAHIFRGSVSGTKIKRQSVISRLAYHGN
jgi:hypothetical protein